MKKNQYIIIFIMLTSIIITGCSTTESSQTDSQTVPENLTPVLVQLSWINEYSVSPFHNGIESDGFAKQGLDVSLVEGGFSEDGFINPIEEVISGNAEFGTTSASNIIVARSEGKPVIAIASVFQRSPYALLSLESTNVERPQDLIGKTVSVGDGGSRQIYDSLLETVDINPEDVNTQSRTEFGIAPLLSGDVDVMGGWIINEGVAIEEAGESYNAILMSDYAVDTYDSIIFTSEDFLENNPEVVEAFVDGLVDGIQQTVDNPEQTIEYTLQFNEELEKDAQLRRLNAMIPLINVPNVPLGSMDPNIWSITHQVLLDNNVIETPIVLEDAFTTEFVESME